MPLDPEILYEIDTHVRGGFAQRDDIIEILTEEMVDDVDLDAAEVESAVDAAFAAHERSKASWPPQTDCDRLDAVFDALEAQGLIALQCAGYTQSDGFDDVCEVYDSQTDKGGVIGYCFYHGQDLDRAVHGQGLYLAFGPMDAGLEETEGPRVGRLIADELRREGFKVDWDGTFAQRIFVPQLDWKRR